MNQSVELLQEALEVLKGQLATAQEDRNEAIIKREQVIAWRKQDEEMINGLRQQLAAMTQERNELRQAIRQEREEKVEWQFKYSLVPEWVRDCLHKHIKVSDIQQQLACMTDRYHGLLAFYDNQVGTPCEQIRHQQEVDELKSQLTMAHAFYEPLMRTIDILNARCRMLEGKK